MSQEILQAALEYAALGWQVVPLYGITSAGVCECYKGKECGSTGKHPRVTSWQTEATTNEEKIEEWWTLWPGSNVGVRFGKESNLIDIECDDDQQEANLAQMFGGEFPHTPTFKSGRGKHRLFRFRDDLPAANAKGIVYVGLVGFRTGGNALGAQSVFPPSKHKSGTNYEWVIHPSEAEVATIPDEVMNRIWNWDGGLFNGETQSKPPRAGKKFYTQSQVVESVDGRDNALTSEAAALWRKEFKAYGPSAFESPETQTQVYEILWALNRAKCIPPMDDSLVRTKCENARKFIQRQTSAERNERGVNLTAHGLELRDAEWWPGDWKLTVVHSDPVVYRLEVPAWKDMIGGDGSIPMHCEQYADANAVARQILMATKTIVVDDVPGRWPAIWNGSKGSIKDGRLPTRGLKAKLLDISEAEESIPEEQRFRVVAEMFADKLQRTRNADKPDGRGHPTRLPEGLIYLRWNKVWEEDLQWKKVTKSEVSELRARLGVCKDDSKTYPSHGPDRARYIILTAKHLKRLDAICSGQKPGTMRTDQSYIADLEESRSS